VRERERKKEKGSVWAKKKIEEEMEDGFQT
jgi:hypothetical protein